MIVKEIQKNIATTALAWVRKDNPCKETSRNRGVCIDAIKCVYYSGAFDCPTSSLKNEAYCAIFMWVALLKAFDSLAIDTSLLKKIKTAGAKQFLINAKSRGIPTNKTPEIGSVFYRKSGDPTASGHVGIVVGLGDGKFYIVDGNNYIKTEINGKTIKNGEGVWLHSHDYSEIASKGFEFIHLHKVIKSDEIDYSFINPLDGEIINGGYFGGDGIGFGLGSLALAGSALLATLFGFSYYNYKRNM